jgi:hypothetical protein
VQAHRLSVYCDGTGRKHICGQVFFVKVDGQKRVSASGRGGFACARRPLQPLASAIVRARMAKPFDEIPGSAGSNES